MRKVASCMPWAPNLAFNATSRTCFTLPLGACVQPEGTAGAGTVADFSQVCMLCADDQNAPRLQIMSAAEKMGIPIQQERDMTDLTQGVFRDEPNLKLFGRTANEVQPEVWQAVVEQWSARPAVLILDQNIAFDDSGCVYGTDVCRHLRELGFTGVIAIRSGNDNESDKLKYAKAGSQVTTNGSHYYVDHSHDVCLAGADDTLSKAMSMKQLISAMTQLARVAVSRAIVAAGKGST